MRPGSALKGAGRSAATAAGQAIAVARWCFVELEQVVRGGHQAPFGANGGSAAAVKRSIRRLNFVLAKDRLDELLSLAIQCGAFVGRQRLAHHRVKARRPILAARSCVDLSRAG